MKTVHHDINISILAVVDIWGGMKKWGADFKIPEVVIHDCLRQPTIVDFCLVLATRLSKRYKNMLKWKYVP